MGEINKVTAFEEGERKKETDRQTQAERDRQTDRDREKVRERERKHTTLVTSGQCLSHLNRFLIMAHLKSVTKTSPILGHPFSKTTSCDHCTDISLHVLLTINYMGHPLLPCTPRHHDQDPPPPPPFILIL